MAEVLTPSQRWDNFCTDYGTCNMSISCQFTCRRLIDVQ